ncbi:MAG: decarboxylase [Saprospiraceae bacterium]|nr:decarboxylase [Saprospiraceae bacterium]
MKWPLFILIFLVFTSCNMESGTTISVEYAGTLKNMMKKGDISTKISLDTLSDKDYLYALGAVAGLKGEIQIFNGQPFISYAQGDSVAIDTTFQVDASLLVYSKIKEWEEIPMDENIKSMEQVEDFIRYEAMKYGINVEQPFPFQVEGNIKSMYWHVINWKEGDTVHTHEKHISSGPHGELNNIEANILGFYSSHHKGVFTHHTSNIHLHAVIPSHNLAVHVDDVTLGNDCILSLPLIKSPNE